MTTRTYLKRPADANHSRPFIKKDDGKRPSQCLVRERKRMEHLSRQSKKKSNWPTDESIEFPQALFARGDKKKKRDRGRVAARKGYGGNMDF